MIARGVKNIKTKGMWPVRGDVLNIKGGGFVKICLTEGEGGGYRKEWS